MKEQRDPVRLEKASRHNHPHRWVQIGDGNFTNPDAAIIWLNLNPQHVNGQYVLQMVGAEDGGKVRFDDSGIAAHPRRGKLPSSDGCHRSAALSGASTPWRF